MKRDRSKQRALDVLDFFFKCQLRFFRGGWAFKEILRHTMHSTKDDDIRKRAMARVLVV